MISKKQFYIIAIFLISARILDFYSTSLWFFQENGFANETNLLSKYAKISWYGIITINSLIVGTMLLGVYLYYNKYQISQIGSFMPKNYKNYISLLYFGKISRYYFILFSIPKYWKVYLLHIAVVGAKTLIMASFLASFHNFSQYYQFEFYKVFRDFVRRPSYVIYSLIIVALIYFTWQTHYREFIKYSKMFNDEKYI